MFNGLWPDVPAEEVPITSVTNGVHAAHLDVARDGRPSSPRARRRLARGRRPRHGRELETVTDEELPGLRRARQGAARHLRPPQGPPGPARPGQDRPRRSRGPTTSSIPTMLTIGFARRFAHLQAGHPAVPRPRAAPALLLDDERPVQLIFAGKAHPADEPGHHLLQEVAELDVRARHPPPARVARGLRHPRGPHARAGVRRLAEHAAATERGVRHARHEGRVQRRAELLDPRRLVGRDVRPRGRLGDPVGRDRRRHRAAQRPRVAERLQHHRAPDRAALLPARRRRPATSSGCAG